MTMIALTVPQAIAQELAVPGGESAEELHITLVYLGDLQGYTGKLLQVVRDFALTNPAVAGSVNGGGTFTGIGRPVSWAYFDSIPLAQFRQNLINRLKMAGIPIRPTHGWVPHITLAYGQSLDIEDINNIPIRFDRVSLHLGREDRVRFPLLGATYKDHITITTDLEKSLVRALGIMNLAKRKKYGSKGTYLEYDTGNAVVGRSVLEKLGFSNTGVSGVNDGEIWRGGSVSVELIDWGSGVGYDITYKEVSASPTTAYGHGPTGLYSQPGLGKRKKADSKTEPSGKHPSSAYLVVGDPNKSSTWHLRVRDRNGKINRRLLGAAWAALTSNFRGQPYKGPGKRQALVKLRKLRQQITTKEPNAGLTVFKDANGQDRWLAITSNAFKDRDEEIVSSAALEADVQRADATKEYGPLRFWHMPGVELGTTDFNVMKGRMLIESGLMTNPYAAQKLKEFPQNYKMSIGFRHPPDEPDPNGIFYNIRRFERSILPADQAANQFTSISIQKESDPMDDQRKLEALKELVGEERFNATINTATTAEKQADGMLIAHKEVDGLSPQELLDYAIDNFSTWEQSEKTGDRGREDDDDEEETMKMGDVRKMHGEMRGYRDEMKGYSSDMKGYTSDMKGYAAKMGSHRMTTKEAEDRHILQKKVDEQSKLLKETMTQLKEMSQDQPPMAGYRPTQDPGTVLSAETVATVKDGQQPETEMDLFLGFIEGNGVGGAA